MNKVLLLTASLTVITSLFVSAEKQNDAEKVSIGKVVITKNDVHAQRNNIAVTLKRRSTIFAHDVITTGEQARAQFRLNDGTLFTLGAQSEMVVQDYQFSTDELSTSESSKAAFKLIKGVFRSVTGKITQVTNPDFTIDTPMGSIGIRGTDFWGGYLDEDRIDVILLSGEHSIIVENEFGRAEITEHGTGITIEAGKAPTQPYPWSDEKLARAVETITID